MFYTCHQGRDKDAEYKKRKRQSTVLKQLSTMNERLVIRRTLVSVCAFSRKWAHVVETESNLRFRKMNENQPTELFEIINFASHAEMKIEIYPDSRSNSYVEWKQEKLSNSSTNNNGLVLTEETEYFSEPEPENIREIMTVVAVLAGVFGFFIMLENIFVLFCLTKGKPRQQRAVTYLIGNLAVADFIAGFHLVWFMCIDFFLLDHRPLLYIIGMCSLWLVTIVVSVMGLFNFALIRLKVAKSNATYKLSKKRALLGIIAAWLLPIGFLVVPPMAGWSCDPAKYDIQTAKQNCSFLLFPFKKNYVLILAILVIVAIVCLFIIYAWMLHAIRQKVSKLKKKVSIKRKEKEMIHSVLIIFAVFTVCILPVAIALFVDYFSSDYNLKLMAAFPVLVLISFTNSLCNPFIYIWRLPAMKSAMWRAAGYKGRLPEKTSFKHVALWRISKKQKMPANTPQNKSASESSDRASRKATSTETATTTNR